MPDFITHCWHRSFHLLLILRMTMAVSGDIPSLNGINDQNSSSTGSRGSGFFLTPPMLEG